jgi:hypothetical protein
MRNKIRYCIRRKTPKPILHRPEDYIYKNGKAGTSISQGHNKYNYYIRKYKRRSYEAKITFEETL